MLVIGLTGGIGCGKSVVADLFSTKGGSIIDADEIARDLVKPGTKGLAEIARQLGSHLINSDNTLNRRTLRELVFSDPEARSTLEEILHPRIRQHTEELLDQFRARGDRYCINVVPLLFETNQQSAMDRVLVIDCKEEQQIRRVMSRDQCSKAEARRIISVQIPRQQRLERADDLIVNDGDLAKLATDVQRLHEQYLELAVNTA